MPNPNPYPSPYSNPYFRSISNVLIAGRDGCFPASGAWTSWSVETFVVSLNAGINTIRLTVTTSGGAPNFELHEGEVPALIGENGAGKSTLMKILTGVYQKDSGEIFIKGEPVNIPNPIYAQKSGISIIYQEFNLFPHLTVADNIFIKREPKKYLGCGIFNGFLRYTVKPNPEF